MDFSFASVEQIPNVNAAVAFVLDSSNFINRYKKELPVCRQLLSCEGAVSGTRTRDPQLGKLMLYQLSYYRIA